MSALRDDHSIYCIKGLNFIVTTFEQYVYTQISRIVKIKEENISDVTGKFFRVEVIKEKIITKEKML